MSTMYLICTTTTDTTTGNISHAYGLERYETQKAAHEAAKLESMRNYRVLPDTTTTDGIYSLSRMVTRTACRLLLDKTSEGNVNAHNLLNRIYACAGRENTDDHDTLDCIGEAVSATWQAITDEKPVLTQYALALRAVYHHVRGERTAFGGRRQRNLNLDAMTDADVAYWLAMVDDIASEIESDEGYNADEDSKRPCLMDCVNKRLTSAQRQIMLLLSEGMTQAQIALVLDRTTSTVCRHVKLSRATLAAYMLENDMQLPDGVTDEDVAAMIKSERENVKSSTCHRSKEGAQREKEAVARRMRAYRERKKAAMNK